MGLISTLSFAAAIATLRIILQRENMLSEALTGTGALIAALVAWLYFRGEEEGSGAGPPEGGDPTPPSNPSTTLNAPADVERWINEATRAANLHSQVSRELVLAVIWQESGGDPSAVGSAGEQGLMQVTAIAAEDVGEPQPSTSASPQRQITVGTKYLSKCFDYVGGDTYKALRCYNEGPPPLTVPASDKYASQVLEKREELAA